MKKIITITISFILLFMISVLNFDFKVVNASSGLISNDTDATQYIGYGYNVAGGKAICDPDALNLNSPILNMDNEELQNAIRVFNSSKTTYLSNTSSSVTEIAEEYGQIMSGDIGLTVGASASKAMSGNVNINVAFNTSKNSSWSSTYSEEYSYFNIVAANKPVILQKDSSELKNYLSDSFMKDLKKVQSVPAAKKLIEKYGTHLLTGYTLGGIFEMTNYYATDSSSYVRQQETSFSAQVNAAISYMAFSGGADLGFSFTDTYGAMDNNTHAVNNYKCTTYGGYVFPGLTIDQAFSYYETLTDAGYMYKIWTDSINTGNNLVIVEIPQSSKLVPLWDLVPYSNEYHPSLRENLINAYMELCEKAYNDFTSEHRDVRALGIPDEDFQIEYGFTEKGYQYYYQINDAEDYVTTYVNTYDDPSKIHDLISGSVVAMDYDEGDYLGASVEWSFGNMNQYIEWKDTQTGVFKVLDNAPNINNVVLTATVDGNQIVYKKTFNIKKKADFKAGDGTKENPYLITNTDEFLKISNDGYVNGGYYFKLLCDLDFKGKTCNVIGTEDKPFNGVFDGNYYTIYNYKLDMTSAKENENGQKYLGLFGYNDGTIKNLTLSDRNGGVYEYINTKNGSFSKLNYLGGVVAINRSTGVVENCHVSGFTGQIKVVFEDGNTDKSEIMVGGVAAYNQGTVKYCSLKKSLIFAKGENENLVFGGGIVAKNENNTSDVSIESCLAEDSYIFVHVGTEYKTKSGSVYGGGICGYSISGIISNCISLDFDNVSKNVPVEGESKIRAVIMSQSYYECNGYLGGIVGKAEKGTTLLNCLVKNISSILASISPSDSKSKVNVGSFAGDLAIDVKVENCIIEEVLNGENITLNQYYINNSYQIIGDITVVNKISWDKIKDKLDENVWKCSSNVSHSDDYYPIPNFDVISSLSIDFTNAKLEFLKGEEFKTGSILVTALHENGDMLTVDSFIINWNDYAKYFDQEFKYFTIFVYCCGLQNQYEVLVREPIYTALNAYLNNEVIYYVGDYLDLYDINIEMIKENGAMDNSITIFDCKIYNKTTNSTDLKLVNGVNEIVIECFGIKDSIYIDVKERTIDHIRVVLGEDAKVNYLVGEKVIDTSNITIVIYYDIDENIDPKVVSLSEGELIFSDLVEGENEILVNYGNYKKATFRINAKYDISEFNKLGFIDTVKEIQNVSSLNEKYYLIVKANKALNELGDYRDDEINESIEQLNYYINEYNELANMINKDFDKTVDVGNSIIYTVLYFTSFSLLGILITLLRKKVQ